MTATGTRTITVLLETSRDPLTLEGRSFERLELPEGATLADAARAAGIGGRLVAQLNGAIVRPADLERRRLADGDRAYLAPSPGDPINVVLAVIAIASAVASVLLLPKIGRLDNQRGERRYLFDRYSRDAVAGDPIHVALGRRVRHGGRVISVVPFSGPAGESKMRILIDLGHGEVARIGDQTADFDRLSPGPGGAGQIAGVYLNDQPAENFSGVLVWGRTGHADQAVIPGFGDTQVVREVGVGGVVLRNTSGAERTGDSASAEAQLFTTSTGGGGVDALVLRFRFARGLYDLASSGRPNVRTVKYRWRFKPALSPTYSDWTVETITRAEQSPFFAERRVDGLDPDDGEIDVQVERVSPEAPESQKVDEITFDSVIETTYSQNRYVYDTGDGGNALLALEITAGEELSGDTPRVSVELDGVKVRRWDRSSAADASDPWEEDFGFSDNPGDLALALLTNARWGCGSQFGLDAVDLESLFAWIEWCEEDVDRYDGGGVRPRFRFSYTLGERMEALEALRMICRAGRATPANVGGKWRFILNRPQLIAREVFTERSIADGDDALQVRYELTTGGLTVPNRLVAEIEDAAQDGEANTIAFPETAADALIAGEVARDEVVQLDGVTDADQALAELIHLWKRLRLERVSVELVTTHEYVRLLPGERFDLATSVVGYGEASGVLRADSTAGVLRFEGLPDLDSEATYEATVIMADSSAVTREVESFDQSEGYTELTLASDLPAAPPVDAEFALHSAPLKPFICERVELDDEESLTWRIVGREMNDDVHDDTPSAPPPPPVYGTIRGRSVPPGPVLDLVAQLEADSGGAPRVRLSWRQDPVDASRTAQFSVYRRAQGDMDWRLQPPRVETNAALVGDIDEGASEEFAVVAVSPDGVQLSPQAAAQAVFGVTTESGGAVDPVGAPDGISIDDAGDGQTLTIERVEGATRYHVEILEGETSAIGDEHIRSFIARTVPQPGAGDPTLTGLRLLPGVQTRLLVRAVDPTGRPSLGFTAAAHTAPTPDGETVVASEDFDLSDVGSDPEEGYENLTWNASLSRLEATDPGAAWSYTSPLVELGETAEPRRLRARALAQQDPEDATLDEATFQGTSAEADQWRVGSSAVGGELRLFAPPAPASAVDLRLFVRWRDAGSGELTAWTLLEHLGEITATTTEAQLRVEGSRSRFPYALALTEARLVATG